MTLNESLIEDAALAWFGELGYAIGHGPHIVPIRIVLPPKELMAAFTAKVEPLYAQITANFHQSRTLATLRDTLLPKLLSGELSVGEIVKRA